MSEISADTVDPARGSPRTQKPGPRILLVSLDNIGDTVFASSLIEPLRRTYPTAHIAIWSKVYAADIARLVPGVDQVVASDPFWDRSPGRPRGQMRPFLRAAALLRASRFDIALLADAPWRAAAATRLLDIPTRIGLARPHNRHFLTHVLPPEDKRRPVLVEMARLLAPLGIAVDLPTYRLDARGLRSLIDDVRTHIGPRLAALHPFASKRSRCAPFPVWRDVAAALTEHGFRILWIGTTTELTELRAEPWTPGGFFMDRLAAADLRHTAAALASASLFVGHDSGPLHIAGAFGVPVLGIFAPGEPLRTFPQGTGPWRMIARAAPGDVRATDVVAEIDLLLRT